MSLDAVLDSVAYAKGETPMTDYQFQQYEKLRDKVDCLERKQKTLHQLVKESVEAGKSAQDILAAVEVFLQADQS